MLIAVAGPVITILEMHWPVLLWSFTTGYDDHLVIWSITENIAASRLAIWRKVVKITEKEITVTGTKGMCLLLKYRTYNIRHFDCD